MNRCARMPPNRLNPAKTPIQPVAGTTQSTIKPTRLGEEPSILHARPQTCRRPNPMLATHLQRNRTPLAGLSGMIPKGAAMRLARSGGCPVPIADADLQGRVNSCSCVPPVFVCGSLPGWPNRSPSVHRSAGRPVLTGSFPEPPPSDHAASSWSLYGRRLR